MLSRRARLVIGVALLLAAIAIAIFVLSRGGASRDARSIPQPASARAASGVRAPAPSHAAIDAGVAALVDPPPGQGRAAVEPTSAAAGSFAGRVINWSTGEGITGADLTFSAGADVLTVTSGADGAFELTPPTAATYALVSADADGFLPYAPEWQHSTVRLAALPGRRVRGLVVFLFPALDYRGTVVDERGKPVAGAKVRLLGSPAGEQALAGPATRWTTDRDGHFTFHAPDDAVLEAELRKRRGRARLDEGAMITHELVITLGNAPAGDETISGRVVDDAVDAMPGVLVTAAPSSERPSNPDAERLRAMAFATTDAEGRFLLTGVDNGTYDLSAEADEHAPARRTDVPGGTRDVVIVLAAGKTITGTAVDGSGAAVPAFTLLVFEPNGPLRELVLARSIVDARGRFAVHVPDGTFELVAAAPGWAPSAPTSASPGDDVTLRMTAGATLVGKVLTAAGNAPIAYARIVREARGGGASAQPANAGTVTRTDGTFELTGIPPGPVSITIGATDHHPRIEAGLVAAEGATLGPITITLKPVAPGETPRLELIGIGIQLAGDPDGLLVQRLIAGGGAESAGIKVGDHVTAVDGVSVATLGLDGAIARIRGFAGTFVRVTVRRNGQDLDLSVERRPLVDSGNRR